MEEFVEKICLQIVTLLTHPSFPLLDKSFAEFSFLQRSFVGMLLVAPLCASVGIQVVNFRLAFFSEAIGHSAFTGYAMGILLSLWQPAVEVSHYYYVMAAFGCLVAILITFSRRSSALSSDTVIGVYSATVVAFGLCVVQKLPGKARNIESFLYGSMVTIDAQDLIALFVLFLVVMSFEAYAYNRLLFIGLNPAMASTKGMHVKTYEYSFAILLALVVMFSVKVIGVLLVTAMLVIPAAAARNFARTAGGMFWWAMFLSLASAIPGLSLCNKYETGVGSTTVLCSSAWFVVSACWLWMRRRIGRA